MDKLLVDSLKELNISINERQMEQFLCYKDILIEWNKKVNLTAITEEREIIIKHFVDSVSVLNKVDIPLNASIIDVGTGAGFPGIPLKIMRSDLEVTLLDSTNKKIEFLNLVCQQLELEHVNNIHSRAEDGGLNPLLREKFDFCVSRAVANLSVLSEYCLPFIKIGGSFVALKGPDVTAELEESKKAIFELGGRVKKVEKIEIPNSDIVHSVVVIEKVSKTPKIYPRKAGTATRKPIK